MNLNKLYSINIEKILNRVIKQNIKHIRLFLALFLITTIIYGGKIFFYSLSNDDYGRFFHGGGEQASSNGRWMAGIFNKYVFTGSLHILPYFNGLLGVFSFTLSGFLTAKYFKRNNKLEIAVITLLITVTPFFPHNLYFNTNISVWLTTLFGIIGFQLAYKKSNLLKLLGFVLLVIAIGSYQVIIQVTIAMVLMKLIIDIMEANKDFKIRPLILKSLLYVGFILLAFIISIIINKLYIEYHHLIIRGRYKGGKGVSLLTYFNRIIEMYKNIYNIPLRLRIFKFDFLIYYSIIFIFTVIGSVITVINSAITKKNRTFSLILLLLLFFIIPMIINLPMITGNVVPITAHYTIGWFLAGFFIILMISFKGVFKSIFLVLSLIIIIASTYYINVFFDIATRQTNADISRMRQVVNRIRMTENYNTEPLEFKIVGKKSFPVSGWGNYQLFNSWSNAQYQGFKHFTDLEFIKMNNKSYDKVLDYLVEKGEIINAYPNKNSIIVNKDKCILFLNPNKVNYKIITSKIKNIKPNFQSTFNVYLEGEDMYYVKSNCSNKDVKYDFFVHVYPKDKNDIPNKRSRKRGFEIIHYNFNSIGMIKNNKGIAHIKLPSYDILKIRTGQYNSSKRKTEWSVLYNFNE